MKLFITGSESFIGSRLWDLAQQAGHEVTGMDVVAARKAGAVCADLREPDLARHIPSDCAIIHLAALSTDGQCKTDPLQAMAVNIGGTVALAQAARQRNCQQFLFASSEWVYGEVANDGVQTEDQPIDIAKNPSVYAFTKYAGERSLLMSDLPNVGVLRFGIVYGPRTKNWAATEAIFDTIRRGPKVEVGSLATARRLIHVDDLCRGILAALGQSGKSILNLSGNRLITIGEVVELSQKILGKRVDVFEKAPESPSIRNPDNHKARTKLSWNPGTPFEEGLRDLASFLANQ